MEIVGNDGIDMVRKVRKIVGFFPFLPSCSVKEYRNYGKWRGVVWPSSWPKDGMDSIKKEMIAETTTETQIKRESMIEIKLGEWSRQNCVSSFLI